MHAQPDFSSLVENPRLRIVTFFFLLMAMFLATLDNQVVSTALPTIVGDFGQMGRFGWVASAYLLASCAVMPIYGKLGDLIGRKYVLLTAIVIFLVGSLTCGIAVSMNTLIAARVLQGFGGGGLMVSIFALNADLFSPRERPKYQSYVSLVLMTSGAIGPTLGGTMTAVFGWRSIFLINMPLGIIVLVGLLFLVPNRKPNRTPKIDFTGAILLAASVTGIVLWSDSSQIFGSMIAPQSLYIIGLTVLLFIFWVLVERRAPEPIIPLRLFANPTVNLLIVMSLCTGAIAIGMSNYFALFLQTVYDLTPATAGLFFIPITSGIVIGSLISGRLMTKYGHYKPYAIIGLLMNTLCFAMLTIFNKSDTPLVVVGVLLAIQGIGVGFGQQVPIIAAQNAVRSGDIGVATSTVTLSRMIGAATAISIYGALLTQGLNAAGPIARFGAISSLRPGQLETLPAAVHATAITAYSDTFSHIFLFAAIIAAIGLIAAIILKPIKMAN